MAILREHIETTLAIDDAFAFVADFANAMHWDPGVVTSERVNDGPVGVGSRYRLGVRVGSRVLPMEYRVIAFVPDRLVTLQGEGRGVSAVDEIRFMPRDGSGTRIDYLADIRLTGLMRLLAPVAGGAFARIATNAREGMQRALDARATKAAGAAIPAGAA